MNEADAARKEIHDLRNQLTVALLKVDLVKIVLQKCPLGYAEDQIVRHRATTEPEILEWLKELYEVRSYL